MTTLHEATEQWMNIERAIDLETLAAIAKWHADGQQGPRPKRRKLTPEERKVRDRYSRLWRKSWVQAGDAPSAGHMKKRLHR